MNRPGRAIGIDIGGTKTTVAAVDAAGRIHARATLLTEPQRGFATCLAELVGAIRDVCRQAAWPELELRGIGIGCAGPVDPLRGTIHNPFTLPGWDGADIVTPLRAAFPLPVRLENDADAAALGEQRWGAGRGADPLVMVTVGTGIGGGFLIAGKIYRGAKGAHPEFGHLAVHPDGPQCYCGAQGCWESLASGSAIAAVGRRFGFADARAVFAAAANDSDAAAIVRGAVDATTAGVWTLLHTLLPQRIILGGGIGTEHFERFAAAIRPAIERATQFPPHSVELVRAALGPDAGVVGAAGLVMPTLSST